MKQRLTEHNWKPLVVSDVLHLRRDDATRLLIDGLVVPVGVQSRQFISYPVVLPHPQCVHCGQLYLFVDTGIACGQRKYYIFIITS